MKRARRLMCAAFLAGHAVACGNQMGALDGPVTRESGPPDVVAGGDGASPGESMREGGPTTEPDAVDASDAGALVSARDAMGDADDPEADDPAPDAEHDAAPRPPADARVSTDVDDSAVRACESSAALCTDASADAADEKHEVTEAGARLDAAVHPPEGGLSACAPGITSGEACSPGVRDCTREKATETCTCKTTKRWWCVPN